MKKFFISLFAALSLFANAQTFDIDMTKPLPAYSDETGYGADNVIERVCGTNAQSQGQAQYLSFQVPDGNYTVTMVIGSKKKAASTTVRAENRRLYIHDLATKKKEFKTVSFVVNKRTPQIDEKSRVQIKDREKHYLTWDNLLTLEITGDAPAVQSIHVERNDNCPTIFLCGNSTVVDQSFEPWASWGQMIPVWFDENVAIANYGESGLATFSFLSQKRLDKILSQMKKGDYVVVEFGHNDEKDKRPGRGAWYNFSYGLKVFVDQVRDKGGNIILCTPTMRRAWEKGNKVIANTHGDFPAAVRAVAERENVPCIDLTEMSKTFFETLGFEDSKRSLVHYPAGTFPGQTKEFADNTHFNPFGAYEVAKMIVMGMKMNNIPLVKNLRSEWQDFNPAQPDDWKTFHWIPSPMSEFVKPDGN